MSFVTRRLAVFSTALAVAAASSSAALAQKKYDPGATDTEIKIGNIMPYSGPASAYGVIGKTEDAYFRKINAAGGINGRKISFISYDDAYSPPKAVEQARKLVESDEALIVFNPLGTPSNSAIQKYMNAKKVPQLFVATGATKCILDEGMKKFYAFLAKYAPDANRTDASVVYGYGQAQTVIQVLKQAGDNLTRENIMKQAASLKDFTPDTLLPGVKINTSATDFYPIEQLQMAKFKGEKWELFGPIINGEVGG